MQLFCAWLWHEPRVFAWRQTPQSSVCLAQCSSTSTQRLLSPVCTHAHWCWPVKPCIALALTRDGRAETKDLLIKLYTPLFSLHNPLQGPWTSADCGADLVWLHHCESSVNPDGSNAFKTTAMQCVCRNWSSTVWSLSLSPLTWECHGRLLDYSSIFFLLAQTGENSYLSLKNKDHVQKTWFFHFNCICLPPECTVQWNYEQQRTFAAIIHFLVFDYVCSPVPQWCSKKNPKIKPLVLVVLQLDQSEGKIWLWGSFLASVF